MYLLKLSANKPSFREVIFNKTGITIIKGTSVNNDPNKTYNGVGKSLMIRIIDFCLGSNAIKGFNVLTGWEFSLDVEIEGKCYTLTRSTEEQSKIKVNGLEYRLEDFKIFMQGKLFPMENKINNLTYRTLISRFLRPRSLSYKEYDRPVDKEDDYARLVNLCYLLGFDLELVESKMQNRTVLLNESKKYKTIMEDPAFIKMAKGKGNFETKIINLRTEIEELEEKLTNFKVSDEYTSIRSSKEEATEQLKKIQNEIFILNKKIQRLKNILALKTDISCERIINLYNKAKILLNDSVKKTVEEVTNFHELMLTQRQNKAKNDLKKYIDLIKEKSISLESLKKDIDDYGNIFKNAGSFEEYQVLNGNLNKKSVELKNIESLQELNSEVETRINNINTNFQNENTKTDDYLKEQKKVIEKIIKEFLSLTKKFYPHVESGIIIENNLGKNKLRYNLSAYISSDSSDGINEVKMFCFDTLLMKLSKHQNNFLIHDNRLLTNVDPRQVVTLFKTANDTFTALGKQYIININESIITGMKESTNWNFVENLFEGENKKIVLELTDENEASMLLGVKAEVKYDK